MASYLSHPSTLSTLSHKKPHLKPSNHNSTFTFIQNPLISNSFPSLNLTFNQNPCPQTTPKSSLSSSNTTFLEKNLEKDENLVVLNKESPVKFIFWVFVWASVSVALYAFSPSDAKAQVQGAVKSIKASSFGLKFANFLRGSGWPDEAVVFALATLPVIELRGAIPVGYWLQLKPIVVTALSVLGLVYFPDIVFLCLL
ncbi:putative small multi-drug export related protein [Tanacetum coccineum]